MVSPDDMLKAAKEQMLDGREPQSPDDWGLIVNFFAANIESSLAQSAMKLIRLIYKIPLTEEQVSKIVDFQIKRKK